jgi:hypothetical protein
LNAGPFEEQKSSTFNNCYTQESNERIPFRRREFFVERSIQLEGNQSKLSPKVLTIAYIGQPFKTPLSPDLTNFERRSPCHPCTGATQIVALTENYHQPAESNFCTIETDSQMTGCYQAWPSASNPHSILTIASKKSAEKALLLDCIGMLKRWGAPSSLKPGYSFQFSTIRSTNATLTSVTNKPAIPSNEVVLDEVRQTPQHPHPTTCFRPRDTMNTNLLD